VKANVHREDYIIRIKSRIDPYLGNIVKPPEDMSDCVELTTRGGFVRRGGSYYVTYIDSETSGFDGYTTTLKFAADSSRAAILRFDRNHGGRGVQLLVEKGRRNLCHYETAYGSMTLGVTADEISCQMSEKGGTARLSYMLDGDSSNLISRNSVEVTVTHIN